MKITIHRNGLRAALLFAAKNDERYYLNAVLVEATSTATRVSATDGHVCAVFQSEQENDVDEPMSILIPREAVALIGKADKDNILPLVLEDVECDGCLLRDFTNGIRIGFDPIAGNFPNIRTVIPATASGEHAQFNPEYIGLMAKAAKVLDVNPQRVMFRHNGTAAGLVLIAGLPEFVAVVMPMKDTATEIEAPLWLNEQQSELEVCV